MLKIDSEFSSLIPPPSAEELAILRESIAKHGCRVPLDVWQGFLVDGHTRYKICQELRTPFKTCTLKAKDRDEVREYIIKHAIGRRNLSPAQRIELAEKLRPQLESEAKSRCADRGGVVSNDTTPPPAVIGRVIDKIAKTAHVSPATVNRYEKVKAEGPLDVVRAMNAGEMSISAAHRATIAAKLPEPEPATTPEDAPLSDAKFLQQKFSEHKPMRALIGELDKILAKFKTMPEEFTRKIHFQSFEAKFDSLKADIRHSAPYAVCAYCSGDKCKACKMSGWQTKFEFNAAPDEFRRAQETR